MSNATITLPNASISLDQLERVDRRLITVPDTRWEWRANDVTDAGGRQIVEASPAALFERLRQGRVRPESIGIEAFPVKESQWVDGREAFEVRDADGTRYHFAFKVGINRKPGKQNYISYGRDVVLAERAAEDIQEILAEYPRRRNSKFLLQHRGERRRVGSTHFWTVVGAVGTLLAIVVALLIHFDENGSADPTTRSAPSRGARASHAEACVAAADETRVVSEVARRLDRADPETIERLRPAVRSALKKACAASDSNAASRMQVVCGFGYTNAPQTYCDAYDVGAEPDAALSTGDVADALGAAGLAPLAIRPTTESFSTIVFKDHADAVRGSESAGFTDYSTQDSGTATPPTCNVVFVPFVGAQNNTHANAMRRMLEAECERAGTVGIDFVARSTIELTRRGSPNCCDPNYPKPESLARAVVVGAGGPPDQAEVGAVHVILFPDQLTTREYLSWYERASEDGGDGGYLSDPLLRSCNAVVRAGGGVFSPEDRADRKVVRSIAERLAKTCHGQVDPVGGKREG